MWGCVSAPITHISSEASLLNRFHISGSPHEPHPDEQMAIEARSDRSEVVFGHRELSQVKGVRSDVNRLIKQRRAGSCWRPCAPSSIIDDPRSETIRAESGGLVLPCWSFWLSNPAIYISGALR